MHARYFLNKLLLLLALPTITYISRLVLLLRKNLLSVFSLNSKPTNLMHRNDLLFIKRVAIQLVAQDTTRTYLFFLNQKRAKRGKQ